MMAELKWGIKSYVWHAAHATAQREGDPECRMMSVTAADAFVLLAGDRELQEIRLLKEEAEARLQAMEERTEARLQAMEDGTEVQLPAMEEDAEVRLQATEKKAEARLQAMEEEAEARLQAMEQEVVEARLQAMEEKVEGLLTAVKVLQRTDVNASSNTGESVNMKVRRLVRILLIIFNAALIFVALNA